MLCLPPLIDECVLRVLSLHLLSLIVVPFLLIDLPLLVLLLQLLHILLVFLLSFLMVELFESLQILLMSIILDKHPQFELLQEIVSLSSLLFVLFVLLNPLNRRLSPFTLRFIGVYLGLDTSHHFFLFLFLILWLWFYLLALNRSSSL